MATQGTVVLTSGVIIGHQYIDSTGNYTNYALSVKSGAWPTTVYKILSVSLTLTQRDAKRSAITVLADGVTVGVFGAEGINGERTIPGIATGVDWERVAELRLTGVSPYVQVAGGSEVMLNIVWELDDVPSTFTLSAASILAGGSVTVTISPYRTSYTHNLTYAFGSRSEVHSLAAGVTSHTFTVPLAWLDQIPNTQMGVGTVILQTLDDGRVIGTATAPLSVSVPTNLTPTFNIAIAQQLTIDGVTYPSMGDGMFVQWRSGYNAVISNAAGQYGASISGYTIRGGGYSGNSSWLNSGLLTTSGEVEITYTVTDSRGLSSSQVATIIVWDYDVPRVASFAGWRANKDTGESDPTGTIGMMQAVWTYTSLGGANTCSAVCYLAPSGGAEQQLNAGMSSGTVYGVQGLDGNYIPLPIITNYSLRLVLTDRYGSYVYYAELPSANFAMHLSADGSTVAFGKACERSNAVEIVAGRGLYLGDDDLRNAPCGTTQAAVHGGYSDANEIWRSGFYDIPGGTNTPDTSGNWWWMLNLGHRMDDMSYRYGMQLAGKNGTAEFFARNRDSSGAGSWFQLMHSGNMDLIRTWLANNGGFASLYYRGAAVNMDTICQLPGLWLTSDSTAGTWPASIPHKTCLFISTGTENQQNAGYRMQELHPVVYPNMVFRRTSWGTNNWTAWYKFSGELDA